MKKRTSILLTGLITVGTLTPVLNVLATDQVLNDTTPKTGTVVDGDKTPGATDDTTNNDDQSVDQKDNGGLLDAPAIQKDTQKEKAPLVGANISVSTPAELAAAVSAATSDTTITLSSSFPTSIPATTELKTTSTAKVTIDGGNKTLTPGGDFIMFNLRIFTGGSLTFQNINFDDSANLSNARALTVLDNTGTLNVDNAKFSNFSSYDDGAAIYFFGNTNITNSTFEGNSVFGPGYSGGALASKSTFGSFKLSNSRFIGNHTDALGTTVGGEGGAVYMFSPKAGASIEMTNNYFEGNTAVKDATGGNVKLADGGAVALFNVVEGNNINISGNTFNKNIAADDGGAMLIQTNSTITGGINVANNTFVGNEAYGRDLSVNSGGAIQLYANGALTAKQTALVNFTNNTFVGNTAKYDGGAIGGFGYGLNYSAGAYKGNIFVNNTAQKNNVADRTTNVPGAGDLGNNIGYDNGTANTVDPVTVFGQFAPALVPNYSGIKAGTSKDAQVIPSIPVVPAKDADNKMTDVLTSVSDQRSFGRALPSDIGAIENKWVKYDSNGGTFELGAD
ncbi:hypothetical protein Q2T76_00005, partial [Lactobacillus sp. YT155]|nr:hypothetical protein [Lactobacillus sp. YT155]